MLLSILGLLLSTFLCWCWGRMVMKLAGWKTGTPLPHPSLVVFTGMGAIAFFAGGFSLFFPLGSPWNLVIFSLPLLLAVIDRSIVHAFRQIKESWLTMPFAERCLFLASIACLLVMSVAEVNHPDTLGYHAQTVKWIKDYPVVPGLALLHERYGFQSAWFLLNALFQYTSDHTYSYISLTLLTALFYFIISGMGSEKKTWQKAGWLVFAMILFWYYPMARLTATSMSPDLPAAVFTWLAFYTWLSAPSSARDLFLLAVFAATATAMKLSVAPVLLLPLLAGISLVGRKKTATAFLMLAITALTITPVLVRSAITSGYVLFPAAITQLPGYAHTLPASRTLLVKEDITAYSRIPVVANDREKVREKLDMPFSQWMPLWWKAKTVADKSILLLALAALLWMPFRLVELLKNKDRKAGTALLVLVIALAAWFLLAPDTRFGIGYLVPLFALAFFYKKELKVSAAPLVFKLAGLFFAFVLLVYGGYRVSKYKGAGQWLQPLGIRPIPYTEVHCNGTLIHLPAEGRECRDLPLPCAYDPCESFRPAGQSIADGFIAK